MLDATCAPVKQLQLEDARTSVEALGPALESAQGRLAYFVGLVSQIEEAEHPQWSGRSDGVSIAAAAVERSWPTRSPSPRALSPRSTRLPKRPPSMLKQALTSRHRS